MSYMTEECYTAHPWMLAAKWHPNRVPSPHYVIGNPCSAITFQCAQWFKLMSHFYSGRTRLPMISFSPPLSWEIQFILEAIVMDASVCLVCKVKVCFVLSFWFFCLILWYVWTSFQCYSCAYVYVYVCVHVCISAFSWCEVLQRCLGCCVLLLCIRYSCLVAEIQEILF